ncbi:MAG: PepSY domain-containing protein [Euryhalocaulis sp.]|uniref:PepSY domain-containing protein n=1 Tax=Euryhalocaulis sp. TaxID=2744307 RepID=UPI00180C3264|nr:PepSY domain-containing protein [Euryhalocaulis sp.]MBA4801064.1 PepSY domain-containing protein [Euryhalocaulis sp.]
MTPIARQRWFSKVHKWLALFVGVQLAIWTASGLVMVLYDIEIVRGEHLAKRGAMAAPLNLEAVLSLKQVVHAEREPLSALLIGNTGRPYWEVTYPDGAELIDARTGSPLTPLPADQVQAIAKQAYTETASIKSSRLLDHAPIEWRSYTPVWQVEFSDKDATRLYIHPLTGRIETVRTRLWRIYDIAWMLHIMDYRTRDNFNNPLVKIAASLGLTIALTGLGLVFYRVLQPLWRKRRISKIR